MTENPLENLFFGFSKKIVEYTPNLLAGLLLIGIGWLLGWLLKRIIVRLCMAFRLDRTLTGFRWSAGLSKSDVRHALYNFIGNAAMLIVFLIFLNDALSVMDLTFLSSLLEGAIFFLPKFLTALVIFIAGWILSGWASGAIHKGLLKEGIPRSALIARFSKTVLLLFFSAMALAELDIAREIVIIGFATIIITLAVITIVLTTRGGKTLVDSILHAFEED